MIDLHLHSTASDGTMTPAQIYKLVLDRGISFFSLTDHDTVAGVPEILSIIDKSRVDFIPGIEITVTREKGECHLLGYGIDVDSDSLALLINHVQTGREHRNRGIIKLFQSMGFDIDYDEILEKSGTQTLGRPHIAAFLKSKGYVRSLQEAFDKYLAVGRPCYLENPGVEFTDAIDTVLKSGGIPVLAHPLSLYLSWSKLEQQLAEWKNLGLEGIEVYHSAFKNRESQRMSGLADKLGFLKTGGSDFHGKNRMERLPGLSTGGNPIPESIEEGFRSYLANR